MKKIIFGLAILATALSSFAQQGQGRGMGMMGGGGSPIMLLQREDVQTDLGINDDQKGKLTELQSGMRDRMMKVFQESGIDMSEMRTEEGRKKLQGLMTKAMDGIKKEIDAILTPAQSKRLNEIFVQTEGNRAVSNPDIAKTLAITDDQKDKLKVLQDKLNEANRGLGEMMRNGELDLEGFREKMAKNNTAMDAEIGKILTDAQKAKLKEMGGKPFVKKDTQI